MIEANGIIALGTEVICWRVGSTSMASERVGLTAQYLQATRDAIHAGRRMRRALHHDALRRNLAIDALAAAAQAHDTDADRYRRFMFEEAEATQEEVGTPQRAVEDLLAAAVLDLHVANVLMAAGNAVGETGTAGEEAALDESLLRLENIAGPLEHASVGDYPTRFGFEEMSEEAAAVHSPDLQSAVANLRSRSESTLAGIVSEAKAVSMDSLKKVDPGKLLDAISQLAKPLDELPRVGRLFQAGVEKFMTVLDTLGSIVTGELLASLKEQLKDLWKHTTEDDLPNELLEHALGVDGVRVKVADVLALARLNPARLDRASWEVSALAASFHEKMVLMRRLAAAIGLAGALLVVTPIAPHAALVTTTAYLLLMSSVVVVGRAYTGAELYVLRTQSVATIVSNVRPT
jgi:hypothetical protein